MIARLLVPVEGQQAGASAFPLLSRLRVRKFARRHTDGHVTIRRRARLGCFLSGHFFLPARNFRLKVRGHAAAARFSAHPVVGVEVLSGHVQQAYRDFTAEELEHGRAGVDFRVLPGPSDREASPALYTFELHHFGNADLDIGSVELADVEAPAETAAAKSWRLSGRLPLAATAWASMSAARRSRDHPVRCWTSSSWRWARGVRSGGLIGSSGSCAGESDRRSGALRVIGSRSTNCKTAERRATTRPAICLRGCWID